MNSAHAKALTSQFDMRLSLFLSPTDKRCWLSFSYMSQIFFYPNVGKLEEFSCMTLPFRRVCLWRHNHFTHETGRLAYHPPPCGWQAGHSGQIVCKLSEYGRNISFMHEMARKEGGCKTVWPVWYPCQVGSFMRSSKNISILVGE